VEECSCGCCERAGGTRFTGGSIVVELCLIGVLSSAFSCCCAHEEVSGVVFGSEELREREGGSAGAAGAAMDLVGVTLWLAGAAVVIDDLSRGGGGRPRPPIGVGSWPRAGPVLGLVKRMGRGRRERAACAVGPG
jgi:hypothetical protein